MLYSNSSAPMYALLNLVNSESHNFTSEVIFRVANNNWNLINTIPRYSKWTKYMGLSTSNEFSDASGLSRKNRMTTKGITRFLRRMNYHRFSDYYFSSFSILGVRGTLSEIEYPQTLYGKFIGKSGTLNKVKSLSGILISNRKSTYVSIITNGIQDSMSYIITILDLINKNSNCK